MDADALAPPNPPSPAAERAPRGRAAASRRRAAEWAHHILLDALTVLLACVAIAWWLASVAAVAVTERVRTRPP